MARVDGILRPVLLPLPPSPRRDCRQHPLLIYIPSSCCLLTEVATIPDIDLTPPSSADAVALRHCGFGSPHRRSSFGHYCYVPGCYYRRRYRCP
jgi:hypothetical protein